MSQKPFSELTACEKVKELEESLALFAMGQQRVRVRYRGDTGTEREIEYSKSNIGELKGLIAKYEGLCLIEQGKTATRRRCFVGGL